MATRGVATDMPLDSFLFVVFFVLSSMGLLFAGMWRVVILLFGSCFCVLPFSTMAMTALGERYHSFSAVIRGCIRGICGGWPYSVMFLWVMAVYGCLWFSL